MTTIRSIRRGALVYLWRADIERIVFARQKDRWAILMQAQSVRRRAAQFLSARFRRVQCLKGERDEREREALQPWREPQRFLQPPPDWMPGMLRFKHHHQHRLMALYERLARTVATAAGPGWFPPPPQPRRRPSSKGPPRKAQRRI